MKFFVPMLAIGLAIGGAANAVTLTFSHTVAPTPVPFSSSFSLPSFDTALGTLTGIEIVVDDTSAATVNIFNLGTALAGFTDASATVPLKVMGPGGVSIADSVTAGPMSGMAGTGLSTFTGLNASNTVSQAVGSGAFSSYETATPQTVSFTALASNGTYTGTGGYNVLFGGSAMAGGTVEVEYTYTAATVPEPAAWVLMMAGVGMMGGVLRRRAGASAA